MKISVIIPVYNTEKYLDECIQSVLKQSFTDFELVLINDGSTDSSGIICDNYAAKDNKVKVFHKKNGGVSSARNLGLENASGELITFVDSDDKIQDNYLETMCNEMHDVEIVYQGALRIRRVSQKQVELESFLDKVENVASFFQNNMVTSHGFICGKLFKSKIIKENEIRFNTSICYSEDSLFTLEYLKYVDKIRFSSKKNYVYYLRPGSLVSIKYSYEKELNLLELANEQLNDVFLAHKINSSLKAKELIYYLHRSLESLYKLEKRDRRFKLNYLLENFQDVFLESYKTSKGRGHLVYLSVKYKNIRFLDFIFKNVIFKS